MQPTPEQASCVEQFATGRRLRINAYAGTGKTSTLTMIAKSTPRLGTYLAFNRSIADEAGRKFPRTVSCSTVHGLAFRAMKRKYNTDKMTGSVNAGFIAAKLGLKRSMIAPGLEISERGRGFLISETVKRWQRSGRPAITKLDVPIEGKLETLSDRELAPIKAGIAQQASSLWGQMIDPASDMPLGHDGYLKLWALGRPTIPGDYILLDEAQDTNGVVLELAKHQGAQVVAVGDKHQQIYEWRGARNAMVELAADAEARLSTSFRFGLGIADYATGILQLLDEKVPLKGNPDRESVLGPIDRPDAILTRTNGQLLEELRIALDDGLTPYIVGGVNELLTYLGAAEKLMRAQAVEYPLDFFGFKDWSDVEEASKLEGGAELQRWVRLFEKHEPTNLRGILERLPKNERDADIILSTGHKSKGREWDAVRLCDGFLPGVQSEAEERAKGALPMNGEADYAAELRLFYVAATRGKVKLEIPPVLNARLEKLAKLAAKSQRKPELVS